MKRETTGMIELILERLLLLKRSEERLASMELFENRIAKLKMILPYYNTALELMEEFADSTVLDEITAKVKSNDRKYQEYLIVLEDSKRIEKIFCELELMQQLIYSQYQKTGDEKYNVKFIDSFYLSLN